MDQAYFPQPFLLKEHHYYYDHNKVVEHNMVAELYMLAAEYILAAVEHIMVVNMNLDYLDLCYYCVFDL